MTNIFCQKYAVPYTETSPRRVTRKAVANSNIVLASDPDDLQRLKSMPAQILFSNVNQNNYEYGDGNVVFPKVMSSVQFLLVCQFHCILYTIWHNTCHHFYQLLADIISWGTNGALWLTLFIVHWSGHKSCWAITLLWSYSFWVTFIQRWENNGRW